MTFETLGYFASTVLDDISAKRVGARNVGLIIEERKYSGEIEMVAFLRATEQPRRVDASLLTENYRENWDIRAQGIERGRQMHLLQRIRQQGSRGRTRRLD